MVFRILNSKLPHVVHKILSELDEKSLLHCRLSCRTLHQLITSTHKFTGKLNDRKLKHSKLSIYPVCTKFSPQKSLPKLHVKTLVIGKLTNSLNNAPLDFLWDTVEEIQFTGAVSSKNYHKLLRVCCSVTTLRINYLAMGTQKSTQHCRMFNIRRVLDDDAWTSTQYHLMNLRSIYVDRGLNTEEYLEGRDRKQFKHFDANLYFKAMARLTDDLEQEVQHSILDMIRAQILNNVPDDPTAGFFFTKLNYLTRFPMNNQILNTFARKLR